ncbi:MAG TPA: AAA family ATPase, partial [Candidatus Cybelea sp.]|nr:AAA family ATPase [Candidatus Cybelea sp.]
MSLDGAPFKFATPRRSLQVLAYLLLHRSGPVTREYLAFVLFPDEDEADARARLRSTLSDMPKILPAPFERYITVDGENVAWNPGAPLWLDVDTFVEASEDPARLREAIELYRGDLLPQIYDEWIESARERYRNTYLRCLNDAVSAARRNADFGSAIESARKILAIDPWREDVVRRIVAMRYESGDRGGALNEYRDFAKRLREEMNADPMPETAALAERIQRGLELPGGDDEPAHVAPSATHVLPFVGRNDELNSLLETWNAVKSGRGTFAFVAGETGIGKSRLATEFAHIVEERGGRVLTGTTSYPEAVPYEGITDALRGALPLLAALKPDLSLAALASLVPELHARVALPDLPRLSPESERIRLFDAVARALARVATQRPLLLLLEDLHWAGLATHDLLQFLMRRIAGTRAMLLITYRDDETPRPHPLQRLRNDAQATLAARTIRLGRLSDSDVADICAALPDERAWP